MFRSSTLRAIQIALFLAVAATWLAPPAAAQAVYGGIRGAVTDTSGGALPGVTVTITSVERQTVDTVVTNESGLYAKERMIPGTYEVKAELASFKTAVVPKVVVNVDTVTPVDFKLDVGQLTESRPERRAGYRHSSQGCNLEQALAADHGPLAFSSDGAGRAAQISRPKLSLIGS